MKKSLQKFLKTVGLYERLRSSPIYDLYWRLADPSIVYHRNQEVAFYRQLLVGLRRGSLIFDIGANQGTKTDVFLRLGARVVSVDPDPTNQEILRKRFCRLRVNPRVTVLGKAVGATFGVETMWIDEPGSAKNTLSTKWVDTLRNDQERFGHTLGFAAKTTVQVTTIEQMIKDFGLPLFIKIDVEGYEVGVLEGMRCAVPFLSFEVNLPEFRTEGLRCVEVLNRLDSSGRFSYAVECRDGLVLPNWVAAEDFYPVLAECTAPSIEVFWKNSC